MHLLPEQVLRVGMVTFENMLAFVRETIRWTWPTDRSQSPSSKDRAAEMLESGGSAVSEAASSDDKGEDSSPLYNRARMC